MKKRDMALDLFKGILTILMVLTHILDIFKLNAVTSTIVFYVCLTTFSGFMFSLGYVSYDAYISKKIDNKTFRIKMIKKFVKTILAFYISGIACSLLVNNDLNWFNLIKILLLLKIPGYSEFLLSFAFMYLVIYFCKNIFNKISNKMYLILVILSLLMTFIDYESINIPILGVFIGTTLFSPFPIVQYFSYFLGGLYIAKNKILIDKKIYLLSFIGTLVFTIYSMFNFVSRFPPSIYWIIGGYVCIYLYYIFCKNVHNNKITVFVSVIGRNTLSYLVISNIIIFVTYRLKENYNITLSNWWDYMALYIILLILCILIPYIYNYIVFKNRKKYS